MNEYNESMIEETGIYRGYRYVIRFIVPTAHRCGYVGIPEGHPLYEEKDDDILMHIPCHGGVTFTSHELQSQPPRYWWIGFDCIHVPMDSCDIDSLRKYYGADEVERLKTQYSSTYELCKDGHIWSLADCIEECQHMIDYIITKENN